MLLLLLCHQSLKMTQAILSDVVAVGKDLKKIILLAAQCSWQQGKFCSARCTCFNCQNGKKSKESKVRSCRCEAGCIQNRCPCFSNQFSCEANPVCRCKNCKNPKGSIHFVEDVEANSALGIRKRCIGKVQNNRSSLYSPVT